MNDQKVTINLTKEQLQDLKELIDYAVTDEEQMVYTDAGLKQMRRIRSVIDDALAA